MYEFDYYKEKVYATESILEGTSIGVPFRSNRGNYYITPNNRLGEFLNEDAEDYNCRLISSPGINMTVFYILEATKDIQIGEELVVDYSTTKHMNMYKLQEDNKVNYKYALDGKFRLNNIADITVAYEHIDQCTDFSDKIRLISAIKESADKYGIQLNFDTENGDNKIEIFTEAAGTNKRRKIESHLLTVFSKLDKTGKNTKFYKEVFSKMTDQQFMDYIQKVIYNEDECFYLEILPYDNEPTLKDIKECLDYMKVPLDEYLYMRYEEDPDNPVRSRYKVAVGYLQIKRMQQILSKKNTYSTDIKSRNQKTGAVTGADKIARISDSEAFVMVASGQEKALQEFMGSRADAQDSKASLYNQIATYGYASLKDMPNDIRKKTTLNTINTYLLAAGIANDLMVDDSNLTIDTFKTEDTNVITESTEIEPLLEANYIVEKPDMYMNLNMWKRKAGQNILFVTGLSGSGKSTISSALAEKYGGEIIELDAIEQKFSKTTPKVKSLIKLAEKQFPEYKNAGNDVLANMGSMKYPQYTKRVAMPVIKWLISEMYKENQLYIVEGIQLFEAYQPGELVNKPFIFKNTSTFQSIIRRMKRNNGGNSINWTQELRLQLLGDTAWMIESTKRIKKYEKALTNNIQKNGGTIEYKPETEDNRNNTGKPKNENKEKDDKLKTDTNKKEEVK